MKSIMRNVPNLLIAHPLPIVYIVADRERVKEFKRHLQKVDNRCVITITVL